MNARITSLATVLDVVVLVGLGLGILFAPLTLIWAFDDGFSTDLLMSWAAALDIWMLGHGVPLSFVVPVDLADALALGALSREFTVDVALLGIGVLTVLWGYRIGRRESTTAYPFVVWILAVGTLATLSFVLVTFAPAQVVSLPVLDAVVRPVLFLATGLAIASWVGPNPSGGSPSRTVVPGSVGVFLRAGFRAGIGSVVAVVTVSAAVVSVLLVVSFAPIISIYEALQPGAMGIIAVSVAQLALLPTVIVWAAMWMVGPGFSLGTGALISPLGTTMQALPALPILGIVPTSTPTWAFIVVLIPVLAAFSFGVAHGGLVSGGQGLWLSVTDTNFYAQPLIKLMGLAVMAGGVGSALGGLLAALTSGSLGPGRFENVGPDPVAIMLWWGLQITAGVFLGGVARALTRSGSLASR
jgi:hypothetical protein